MKKFQLSPKQKKWLLAAHVLCMVAWLGGTLCLLTLNVVAATTSDPHELYVTNSNLNVIDEVFIKFPALGTLITGLLLSILTNWGLTHYGWIITKEIVTLSVIGFGILGMNRWSAEATALLSTAGGEALHLAAYAVDRNLLLSGAVLNSLALATLVVVSYLKPWGKRTQPKEQTAANL